MRTELRCLVGCCVLAAALAGCGGSSAPTSSWSGPGAIGSTQTLNDGTGDTINVTVVKVKYPARPAARSDDAPAGNALVEVLIKVVGASGTYQGNAGIDVAVIASDGQTYSAGSQKLSGCTSFKAGAFSVSTGKTLSGCVAVPIKKSVKPKTIEFDAGAIGTTGTWKA